MNLLRFRVKGLGGWAVGMGCAMTAAGLAAESQSAPGAAGAWTIEQLVAEALAANPELNFYRAEITAAKGAQRTAGQWANPEAGVSVGYKRVDDRAGGRLGDGAAWAVSVSQTFDFPGRLSLRKAIANRQVALAELGLEQFRAGLAVRVRQQAFRTLAAQQNAQAAREVCDRVQELLGVLVQRDPAGVTPLLETRVIEANAITLQRRATLAEQARQAALLELNQLVGKPLDTVGQIAATEMHFPPAIPLDRLLAAAHTNNFELRLRKAELEQQGFAVQLSRKARWPSVTLAPFFSHERAADEEQMAGVGFTIPLPLWDRKQGDTEAAQARLQQAETLMQVTQRDLERRLTEHALAYQKQLTEMARWRPDASQQFREAAELGDRHYRLGSLPVSIYLELQQQYLDATDALLQTQAEALERWQQLELLVGVPLKTTE